MKKGRIIPFHTRDQAGLRGFSHPTVQISDRRMFLRVQAEARPTGKLCLKSRNREFFRRILIKCLEYGCKMCIRSVGKTCF